MPIHVTDARSGADEQIDLAARVIRNSAQALKVFEVIHRGKMRVKTVSTIALASGLTRKQVLTQGKKLVDHHLVEAVRHDGELGYLKDDFVHRNKRKILALARDPRRLERFPTKRRPSLPKQMFTILSALRPPRVGRVRRVTVDDIDSFVRVRRVLPDGPLPESVSEKTFKLGVQRILAERGVFSDWGGERNDLYTTHLRVSGRRRASAFAFKGPGTRGRLVPAKLGKNGDQIQRLFQTDADLFFVQYHGEIDQSVVEQMQAWATLRTLHWGADTLHGVIDGQDSYRLYRAFPRCFQEGRLRRS